MIASFFFLFKPKKVGRLNKMPFSSNDAMAYDGSVVAAVMSHNDLALTFLSALKELNLWQKSALLKNSLMLSESEDEL